MSKKWFIPAVIGIFIILLAVLVGFNSIQKSSQLKGLPNYTEIRGDINITDGIQYGKQPSLGSEDAAVKVVEFADFKCPACKRWTETYFDKLKSDYIDNGKVQFYFMNYAFIDRDSIMAASAGEAINKQSKEAFWNYYKLLFANQGDEKEIWATPQFLKEFVKKNIEGIDYKKFEADLANNENLLAAKEDYKIGGSMGINGTPQFIVNGKLLSSSSYEDLVAAIEVELNKD